MSSSTYNIGVNQNVAVSSSSATTSNAVGTPFVRLASTTACYVVFGTNPTATTSGVLINAGAVGEVFKIPVGYKVAAIRVSADGVLSVTAVDL